MQVDWLNIRPLTGGTGQTEVYAYVTPNEKPGSTRRATVRFTNTDGLTADLNITQVSDTSDLRFVLSPDYLYVPGGGGTYYVNVLTNTYWKVTDYDSGLTITTDNMEGFGDGLLEIVFPPNPNTNNQYGYDHNGRPFYGREGYITVASVMGTKRVFWEQAAYAAITVTPNKLFFSQTGGTLSATVKSSMDWQITSYDSATTSFSALSGHSGETVIYVTKAALTQTQIDYYVTKPSKAEFSDGQNVALLFIESNLDNYYNDDDWITVTYDVPSANTQVKLYGYDVELAITPDVVFEDDDHTAVEMTTWGGPLEYGIPIYKQYYTTFTTPGEHIVKYRFNKEGCIMPKYAFPGNIVGTVGEECYKKIVIGNRCEGSIYACAAVGTSFKEVNLGLGNITSIGEYAFRGCGSYEKDFVYGDNVQDVVYEPFHQMKAKKFVFNKETLGGSSSSSTITVTGGPVSNLYISGNSFSYSSNRPIVTGTTNVCTWEKYPGDINSIELVIGQNVKHISNSPFYPFGFNLIKSGTNNYTFDYIYASNTFRSQDYSKIKGWTTSSISCVSNVSPTVENYAFTPVVQTFKARDGNYNYGTIGTYSKGPSRSIPFHYPIGADYSAWSSQWSNMIGDLNI